jgi:hypothetical protein
VAQMFKNKAFCFGHGKPTVSRQILPQNKLIGTG